MYSHFAEDLACQYCGKKNSASNWPEFGDMIPFHFRTIPGPYRVTVDCPRCQKKWWVVWEEDPGKGCDPNTPTAPSPSDSKSAKQSVKWKCRSCQKPLRAASHKAGKAVACPHCQKSQLVPYLIQCPSCGANYQASQAALGKTFGCQVPSCQVSFTAEPSVVPSQSTSPAIPSSNPEPEPADVTSLGEFVSWEIIWDTRYYFTLPIPILEKLQTARSFVQSNQWNDASNLLHDLLDNWEQYSTTINDEIVRRRLAFCLYSEVTAAIEDGWERVQQTWPTITLLVQRESQCRKFSDRDWELYRKHADGKLNILEGWGGMNDGNPSLFDHANGQGHYCALCLNIIPGRFQNFKHRSMTCALCRDCGERALEEREAREPFLRKMYTEAKLKLLMAQGIHSGLTRIGPFLASIEQELSALDAAASKSQGECCPQCGRKRLTKNPICSFCGEKFPQVS